MYTANDVYAIISANYNSWQVRNLIYTQGKVGH